MNRRNSKRMQRGSLASSTAPLPSSRANHPKEERHLKEESRLKEYRKKSCLPAAVDCLDWSMYIEISPSLIVCKPDEFIVVSLKRVCLVHCLLLSEHLF